MHADCRQNITTIILYFFLQCSTSCGTGLQVRTVECHDNHGAHNTQCDPHSHPLSIQPCSTGIVCATEAPFGTEPTIGDISSSIEISEITVEKHKHQEKLSKEKYIERDDSEDDEDEDEELVDKKEMYLSDEPQVYRPLVYQYSVPRAERLVDPNVPNEPT